MAQQTERPRNPGRRQTLDGSSCVLAEYDRHGRIRGGDPEQMMDAAAAACLALSLDGTDTLLMAADHALRRELSRRVREDLIRLGVVSAGPAVRIADGAAASAGDLIICTRNDHSIEAGEPGRTLANGDLLRIEAVAGNGLIVRRALDADPRTGQRRWTSRPFLYAGYGSAELGYAVTDHVAQGRTVTAGLAVITGTEDRQHAYVALSRGTSSNSAYVFTVSLQARRPRSRPQTCARTGEVRPDTCRTGRRPRPRGHPVRPARGSAGRAVRCPGTGRPAPVRRPGPAACPGQRRSPGHLERDLGRRDRSRPPAAVPRPARGQPAARLPPRPGPSGPVAVADPARRRAGRPGPGTGASRRDRRTGPGRIPRPGRRHRRPPAPPPRLPRSAAIRVVVRPGPGHHRPPAPRLCRRDRRADGRAQGPPRRARRRQRPVLGGQRLGTGPGPSAGPAELAMP